MCEKEAVEVGRGNLRGVTVDTLAQWPSPLSLTGTVERTRESWDKRKIEGEVARKRIKHRGTETERSNNNLTDKERKR